MVGEVSAGWRGRVVGWRGAGVDGGEMEREVEGGGKGSADGGVRDAEKKGWTDEGRAR